MSHKREDYPETRYVSAGPIRLIFREGKYHGWYRWRES